MAPRRTRATALAVLASVAVAAAGCTADAGQDASGTSGDQTVAADASFPVTIEHVYGETEISAEPERIVTLGGSTADVIASLGIVPVGIPENTWSGDADGYNVWTRAYIEQEMQEELPALITATEDGPDYEQILALQPDLILAPTSGLTEVQYERLTEIAPTVAHADQPYIYGTWQDLARLVGTALGEGEKAEDVIDETEAVLADALTEHPELDGTSFVYSLTLGQDGGTELALYISDDPRVVFHRSLGLLDSPSLESATADHEEGIWYGGVSLEELDTIDTDVVLYWSSSPENTATTLENALVSRWEPMANGNYLILENTKIVSASNGPTPITIPWMIEQGYLDDLSAAVDGGAVVRSAG
ncbi:ABC transporter substrate-binding protein [Microbacterium marinilacus]|uniref:ABC transporter substrate-binding protein n=1 Tax=Microbacterium marinilacus TaxID=415209 RepID=A0ABP7B3E9_9MICO|nr:ABC transporter substrate-binding protein [Microbacterium marinilacus]MBY0687884.1 ABC transporter substrate-binding protein [Microbacterium marinilacus]